MGRYTGAACKKCRRAKEKLFLKGDKCYSAKCPVKKRAYPPGQHGKAPSRLSEYGIRLREKQKARQIYGISERQFENYFDKAARSRGVKGTNLLVLLERRLDNIVYRLGLCKSRREARQFVKHGHVMVKGKKMNVPSYQMRTGEKLVVLEHSAPRVKKLLEEGAERKPPEWLELDKSKLEAKVLRYPQRDEIDTLVEDHLIIEYYSR